MCTPYQGGMGLSMQMFRSEGQVTRDPDHFYLAGADRRCRPGHCRGPCRGMSTAAGSSPKKMSDANRLLIIVGKKRLDRFIGF